MVDSCSDVYASRRCILPSIKLSFVEWVLIQHFSDNYHAIPLPRLYGILLLYRIHGRLKELEMGVEKCFHYYSKVPKVTLTSMLADIFRIYSGKYIWNDLQLDNLKVTVCYSSFIANSEKCFWTPDGNRTNNPEISSEML